MSFEEPSAAARVLKDYVKDNEKLQIKAGLMDGEVLDAKAVENQLATLPSKDEARATLLAQLMAPAQTFVRLINAPAQNFALFSKPSERRTQADLSLLPQPNQLSIYRISGLSRYRSNLHNKIERYYRAVKCGAAVQGAISNGRHHQRTGSRLPSNLPVIQIAEPVSELEEVGR